jgi:hypothetical protein
VGSDAHRAAQFGFGLPDGYAAVTAAGVDALTFRRSPGTARVEVPIPREAVAARSTAAGAATSVRG